jgi:glucose/arabinose dehydrogenase
VLAALALLGTPPRAQAGPPDGFELRPVVSGLTLPTAFAHAPDGRIFIAEDAGVVRVWDDGALTTFVDLRAEVNSYSDRGLLGIALDPDFAVNRWVYLLHTAESSPSTPDRLLPTTNRLIRIRAASELTRNVADPLSKETLLGGMPQEGPWHSIGTVAFDADGFVLIGTGDVTCDHPDTFSTCRLATLDLDSPVGKILRFDPATGEGAPGNPYYDPAQPAAMRSLVLARGFRNPFRFTVDHVSGRIHVGDVGQSTWEELDVIEPTWSEPDRELNYGWPCYEGANGVAAVQPGFAEGAETGPLCELVYSPAEGGTGPGTQAPAYAYDHDEPGVTTGSAIVPGPVYRASAYPGRYHGRLFLADYARDRFQTRTEDGTVEPFGTPGGWGNPVDIKLAPNGNLAFASITGGTITEIAHIGQNRTPVAAAAASPESGPVPLEVRLTGSGSSDPDEDPLGFSWDFGDGSPVSTAADPVHTYQERGSYTATLTVSDGRGGSSRAEVHVDVGNTRPTVAFTAPVASDGYVVGSTLPISIMASDDEDGPLAGASVTWSVVTHHGGHVHPGDVEEGTEGSYVVPDHADDSFLELVATATDSDGAVTTTRLEVPPTKVPNLVSASVTGTELILDGVRVVAPYEWDSIPGGSHQVSAPATAPTGRPFARWASAGGPLTTSTTHDFLTPAAGISLEAQYESGGGAFRVEDGTVVMEAESAEVVDRVGIGWAASSPAGAVGQAMVVPEGGGGWGDPSTAPGLAPELRFPVLFPSGGTYAVYVRSNPPDQGSNSVHVGVNGQIGDTSDHITRSDYGNWQWMRYSAGGPNPATVTVPSAGVHEVSVWAREDGTVVDRVVLTQGGIPSG